MVYTGQDGIIPGAGLSPCVACTKVVPHTHKVQSILCVTSLKVRQTQRETRNLQQTPPAIDRKVRNAPAPVVLVKTNSFGVPCLPLPLEIDEHHG
jgi:hypothetical protein